MTLILAERPGTAPRRGLEWQDKARCAETDPELFFPENGVNGRRVRQARQACWQCEVRAECLAYALSRPGTDGIWGGTTERERRVMRKAARR